MPDFLSSVVAFLTSATAGSWALTIFGVVITQVYSLNKKPPSASVFLLKIWPGMSERRVFVVDALINLVVGSIIGQAVYAPRTPWAALAAGVTWGAGLNLIAQGKSK